MWRTVFASGAVTGAVLGLLGVVPQVACASDWPQWRGPKRDGVSDEKGLADKWPDTGPPKVWEAAIGSEARKRGPGGSPVVCEGKVVVCGRTAIDKDVRDALYCFGATDGKLLWKHEWKGRSNRPPNGTPAVADGRVFFLDGSANFMCVSADDGKLLWRKRPAEAAQGIKARTKYGAAASPAVFGDAVYIGTAGFRAADGAPLFGPKNWGGHSSTVLGAIGGKKALVGHGMGLDAETGEELWKIERCGAICTPVLLGKRLLNVGLDPEAEKRAAKHARLYGITVEGGKFSAKKLWAQPKLPASGNPKYQVPSFTVSGDHAYGRFGYAHKTLVCFDVNTGGIRWSARGKNSGMQGECYSSPLLADGKLYCLDGSGCLFMIKDDPGAFVLLDKAQVCGKAYGSPALSRGFLYVRDATRLICLRIGR